MAMIDGLPCYDVNGDNRVTIGGDISAWSAAFGQSKLAGNLTSPLADVDEGGAVTIGDEPPIASQFGLDCTNPFDTSPLMGQ